MKTISKKILKTNYYYEFKNFYDDLPNELPIPENYIEKVNTKRTTEKEMIEGNESFSKEEAFGLICKFIEDKKDDVNIVWFKDNNDVLCRVRVRLDSSGWRVYVDAFDSSDGWIAGFRSFFRNKSLDTLSSETLTPLLLEKAIQICKENGLKIIRTKTVEEEL